MKWGRDWEVFGSVTQLFLEEQVHTTLLNYLSGSFIRCRGSWFFVLVFPTPSFLLRKVILNFCEIVDIYKLQSICIYHEIRLCPRLNQKLFLGSSKELLHIWEHYVLAN